MGVEVENQYHFLTEPNFNIFKYSRASMVLELFFFSLCRLKTDVKFT